MTSAPRLAPLNPLVFLAVFAEYVATTVHHVYGGVAFDSPERLNMALAFTGVFGLTLLLYRLAADHRAARLALAAVLALFWVGLLGGYEGGYNHVVASVRFLLGEPVEAYPPDLFFQATGVLTFAAALATAAALVRLTRRPGAGGRLHVGAVLAPFELESVGGGRVMSPTADRFTHLQFRRFAGCPVCDLHLRSFARRISDIENAGVREVAFFHSSAESLRPHVQDLPFAIIADAEKRLYRRFGVEAGLAALLDPRAWAPIVRSVSEGLARIRANGGQAPRVDTEGGRLGLPADFLIDPTGRVVACHYGEHVYDQWSVDDVLDLTSAARRGLLTANESAPAPEGAPKRSARA